MSFIDLKKFLLAKISDLKKIPQTPPPPPPSKTSEWGPGFQEFNSYLLKTLGPAAKENIRHYRKPIKTSDKGQDFDLY